MSQKIEVNIVSKMLPGDSFSLQGKEVIFLSKLYIEKEATYKYLFLEVQESEDTHLEKGPHLEGGKIITYTKSQLLQFDKDETIGYLEHYKTGDEFIDKDGAYFRENDIIFDSEDVHLNFNSKKTITVYDDEDEELSYNRKEFKSDVLLNPGNYESLYSKFIGIFKGMVTREDKRGSDVLGKRETDSELEYAQTQDEIDRVKAFYSDK